MSEFFPTEQGAEQVLRAGRRRRTAKVSASGSSALAVAVAFVLTSGGGSTRPQPDQLTTTSSPTAATSSPAPSPSAPPVGAASSGSPRSATSGGVPTLGPSSAPGPASPPPAQHRTTTVRHSPITRSTGSIAATDLCQDGQTDQARTWCVRAFDPGDVKRGTTVSLGGEICDYPTSSPLELDFADTAEVQIAIDPYADQEKWHAGEGYRYAKPGPTVTVAPGQCLQWHAPWDTRDHEGFVVPPGSYQLNVYVNTRTQPGYIAFRTITVVD
jgi:hypothetical protein